MKVAILGESSIDEAICQHLLETQLGRAIEPVDIRIRSRGWSSIFKTLRTHLLHLEHQTDADGLAVLLDSDFTPIHDATHAVQPHAKCRVCQAWQIVSLARGELNRSARVKVAIGLAAPSIEAWLLVGESDVGETPWRQMLRDDMDRAQSYRDTLKARCFGSRRMIDERAIQLSHAMAADLATLERQFPDGFRTFATDLRSW